MVLPIGLGWSDVGDRLFVLAGAGGLADLDLAGVLYRVDPDSGALTPLGDASQIQDKEELLAVDETTGYQKVFEFPRTAIMAPDRSAPLILHRESADGRASRLSVVTEDGELITLYDIEEYQPMPAPNTTIAADGKALVNGYLFLPEE
jgi:hypothetical protein